MAFHSYARLIQKLFNAYWFGPPCRVTGTSPWPRVDHPVSRLPPPTRRPLQARFHCGCAPTWRLTSPATATRRLIMQKARRHRLMAAPTACRRMVSGTISLPSSGCFSPFPHGTRPLSVSWECLALPDGPGGFTQGSTCPALLRMPPRRTDASHKGLSPATAPLSRGFRSRRACKMSRSYYPAGASPPPAVWAAPRSLATTGGITVVFSSWRY